MAPTEYCRTELKVPNDPRALGAVRGALEHTTRHVGLSPTEESLLISSTNQLLRSVMDTLSAEAYVFIGIQERVDRIEIELSRPGGNSAAWAKIGKMAGIDEVEQESSAGNTCIKLVKFLQGGTTPAHLHN